MNSFSNLFVEPDSVTRGVNGTTAAAHAINDQVRGTVDDEKLRYVHICLWCANES